MLDPRLLLRWIYIGRLSISVAIFLAAVLVWTRADTLNLLIASLGNVLYVADVIWAADTMLTMAVWLQLGVFVLVALGSGYLSVLLRREGEGKALLVAELLHLRLQADDILRNIRSGVLTVDS